VGEAGNGGEDRKESAKTIVVRIGESHYCWV
jgi:hypothetical protein